MRRGSFIVTPSNAEVPAGLVERLERFLERGINVRVTPTGVRFDKSRENKYTGREPETGGEPLTGAP